MTLIPDRQTDQRSIIDIAGIDSHLCGNLTYKKRNCWWLSEKYGFFNICGLGKFIILAWKIN